MDDHLERLRGGGRGGGGEGAFEVLRQRILRELGESGDKEVSSLIIGERVMARLKALDEVAYVRFASVYRSFRDIDEFMSEMGKLVRSRPD